MGDRDSSAPGAAVARSLNDPRHEKRAVRRRTKCPIADCEIDMVPKPAVCPDSLFFLTLTVIALALRRRLSCRSLLL